MALKKISTILLFLLLIGILIPVVSAVDWSFECPYVTSPRGGCPALSSGSSNLFAWRDFGSSEELCGVNPLANHYWECGYTYCGNVNWFSEFHCGGALSTENCAGMVYETPYPSVLLYPSGQVVFDVVNRGDFQYYVLNEVGTYIVTTVDNFPTGENITVVGCDLSTTLTLPANVTENTCYITTTGECNPALSLVPQCSFTAEPRTGIVPFSVSFSDTSTNIVNPQLEPTYREWIVTDNDTFVDYFTKTEEDWIGWFTETGKSYNIDLTVGNVFGYCHIGSIRHINTGTSNQTGQYTLTVYPETVSPYGVFSALLSSTSGNFNDVNSLMFGWEDELGNANVLHDSANTNYILQYSLVGGSWYQYDTTTMSYSVNKGATFPNPVSSLADIQLLGIQNYIINAFLHKTTGETIKASDNLIISNANYQILTIDAKDYLTGALINGAEIDVLNWGTSVWDNKTSYTGSADWNFPYGTHIYIESKATGYVTATKNWTVSQLPNYRLWMIMYRGAVPPAGNVTLHVTIGDYTDGSFLPNALVQVLAENTYTGLESYTSLSGTASFTVLENTNYLITASKAGYQTASKTINTGPGEQAIETLIILHRSVTPTPTPIPTVTPTATIPGYQPGVTQPGGGIGAGNFTGFWAPFQNMFLAMGAMPVEVGLLMAFVLTLICFFACSMGPGMAVGTMIFNPLGGEIGAIVGVVLSIAFNFFPLYLAIIAVVGLILYVSLRVYGVTR